MLTDEIVKLLEQVCAAKKKGQVFSNESNFGAFSNTGKNIHLAKQNKRTHT